ncbi:MAG TPA: hypothetical protein VM432_08485 [Bdellovibrionales bacterium]|nr:hypothetical protein [Bdellovibrionales bacterium]
MDAKTNYTSTHIDHEIVLMDENTCCLCGTELKFEHKIDYMILSVKEEASCPACRIKMKSKEFVLQ